MRNFPMVGLCLILLSGCASLTEEQCQIADWRAIGQSDAMEGYRESRFQDHIKACKRYNVVPDKPSYQKGREQGLQRYCTAENGFRVGRQGYRYNDICPTGLEAAFLGGHRYGARLHGIELDIASTRQEIIDIEDKLRDLQQGKADKSSPALESKASLRRQLRRLERELDRLDRERERELVASEAYLLRVAPET